MNPRRAHNVFLVGFMASGKSRLGRALARRLGWKFLDTDAVVEAAERMSISRIFSEEGEARFRRLEVRAISRAARGRRQVISIGGGAVLDSKNVAAMRAAGVVIYRQAPFKDLFKRGERDRGRRPLWKGRTRDERRRSVKRLHLERRPLYRRAAHFALRTSGDDKIACRRLLLRLLAEGWIAPRGIRETAARGGSAI